MTSSAEGTNGNGGVRPLIDFIVRVGVPAAIALYLVWITSGRVAESVELLRAELTTHVTQSVQEAETQREMRDLMRYSLAMDLQACIERAAGNTDRVERCFAASKGEIRR